MNTNFKKVELWIRGVVKPLPIRLSRDIEEFSEQKGNNSIAKVVRKIPFSPQP